jgi:hypothetical protein
MGLVSFWGLNDAGETCNEDPDFYSDPWDTFFINTNQLPGLCWVEGKTIAGIEIVKKKGKNSSGARITILGYDPGEFDVVCRIVTPSQWDIFQVIRNHYWAGPSKTSKPPALTVNVRYPDLNSLNIYQGVVIGCPLGTPSSDIEGARDYRIRFHEQVAQKATKAKSAAGALPLEDERQPASAELNAPAPAPSTVAANTGLDGPPLTSFGSAN